MAEPSGSLSQENPGLVVGQVFLDSATFSHREDALSLPPDTKPEIGDVQLQFTLAETADGSAGYIRIAVTTDPAKKPIYNVALAMIAVIVRGSPIPAVTVQQFIRSPAAVSLLYPFVREAFANLTSRGRFGPVWLNPINPKSLLMPKAPEDRSESAVSADAQGPLPGG